MSKATSYTLQRKINSGSLGHGPTRIEPKLGFNKPASLGPTAIGPRLQQRGMCGME